VTTSDHAWTLALDIGGTKIAAGLVRPEGTVVGQDSIWTRSDCSADDLFADLAVLCDRVLAAGGIEPSELVGIGVGCGGPMEYPEGRVSPINIPPWRGFPLRAALEQRYGRPALVDNDAKALALGEYTIGAGRGARCLLGMVVSTGVGGGIVEEGRLIHGVRGNAGHVGHVIAYPGGPLCGCGARGCVEGVASGTGLARRAREAKAEGLLPGLPDDRPLTGEDVVNAAVAGDATALTFVREAGIAVGRGIAGAAALLDLDRVVIGGSIALKTPKALFFEPLVQTLREDARLDFTRGIERHVMLSDLGVEAALAGAAALLHGLPAGLLGESR
jgi:glucokinase